jgi:hypothetical protein
MQSYTRRAALAGALFLCLAAVTVYSEGAAPRATRQAASAAGPPMRWYKGNTHTHTINQGGDSTPDEVARWYREHGYQFLVITDHNFVARVDALNALHGADEKFLVIQGEEVTSSVGGNSVHVNGLDLDRLVEPHRSTSIAETLQANIDGIRAASGVPHINHPNHTWSLTTEHLREARNYKLFEIHNGHPSVNNAGGGGVPGLEEVWDRLLTSGMLVYGLATDDAHVFKDPGNPRVSGPGRGWVTVRAPRLDARTLMASLEQGDFYASTGVELDDVQVTANAMTIKVKPEGASKYRIQFIGRGGRILSEAIEPAATYTFAGDEVYVRAKVIESNGRVAWVQPVQVPRRTTSAAVRNLWHVITARFS